MPLPLALAIAAGIAGVTGVGSGIHGAKKMKDANFVIDNLHLSLDSYEYYREIIFTTSVLLSNLRFIWQGNE